MANIYNDFVIVDEKLITDNCGDFSVCRQHINSKFSDLTAFDELEFTFVNETHHFQIKDNASRALDESGPLAQIVSWKWEGGNQKIEQTMTLHKCGSVEFECEIGCSVVIRILEKRQMTENPFPPIATADEGVTVQIADRSVKVSAHLLMAVSPVFDAMLSHDMKEKAQGIADLTKTFGTIERFVDFLYHIDPNAVHGPYRPNPKCVLDLLKFARHYQMDGLKERCAVHLVNCVEFPLVERFVLMDTFCLPKLKDFFLRSLSVMHFKAFWKANLAQLRSHSISKELFFDLSVRLCDDE